MNKLNFRAYLEIRQISSVQQYFCFEANKTFVSFLVLCRLDYCNAVLVLCRLDYCNAVLVLCRLDYCNAVLVLCRLDYCNAVLVLCRLDYCNAVLVLCRLDYCNAVLVLCRLDYCNAVLWWLSSGFPGQNSKSGDLHSSANFLNFSTPLLYPSVSTGYQ